MLLSLASPGKAGRRGKSPWDARRYAVAGLDAGGGLTVWRIDAGCPEISSKPSSARCLYEGYDSPAYVWQTTGGEDFEPKFSLVPLLFGTLKGTFYAMLFAAPMALFGAAYVSYFTTPGFRRTIKPVVEIMATVPSVVIGFLIALWLAPIIERSILAFFLSLVTVPGVFVASWSCGKLVRRCDWAKRIETGYEFLVVLPVLLAGVGRGRLAGGALGNMALRRQFPAVAVRRAAGHALRPTQQHHHRLRPGVYGHPHHFLDRRGLAVERALQHDVGLDGPGRQPLANAVARRAAVGQSGHFRRHDDRLRPRRGRNDDRADGHRQHADPRLEPLERNANPFGQHRRGNSRSRRSAARFIEFCFYARSCCSC